jgi:uncharacterized protein
VLADLDDVSGDGEVVLGDADEEERAHPLDGCVDAVLGGHLHATSVVERRLDMFQQEDDAPSSTARRSLCAHSHSTRLRAGSQRGDNGGMADGRVAWLHVAPVKSMALHAVDEIWLELSGARNDRRFLLVDEHDRLVNGKRLGRLVRVQADWAADREELTLTFPDGVVTRGTVRLGESRPVTMYGDQRWARPVVGEWSDVLSAWAGQPLQLMQPQLGDGLDRTGEGGATLVGVASLGALAEELGVEALDARRFRMLIGVDGLPAYGEDAWVSRRVRVGDAMVRVHGNVGRCAVTTQDPDSGRADLPTLHALQRVRGDMDSTEPLPFGVWGEVLTPGRVALGDPCEALTD